MKASQEDVQRVLQIAEPFFDEIRMEWAAQIIRTMPNQQKEREDFYAMIAGLNRLQKKLREYAAPKTAAKEPDPTAEVDWYGNPIKENENG
jgi:thioredoxin-like negative regulator of GroEL